MKYGAFFSGITAGQVEIPVGTKSWSVYATGGNAWIDGTRIIPSVEVNGGGYDGRANLDVAINVGITGGYLFVRWEA